MYLKKKFHIPIHTGNFVEKAKQHFCNPQLSSLFSLDMISLFFEVQLKFSVFHRHKFDLSFSRFSGCFLNGKHKCFPPLIILLDEGKVSVTSWSPLSVLQLVLSLSAASGAHENTTKIFRCVNHYSMLTRYFSFWNKFQVHFIVHCLKKKKSFNAPHTHTSGCCNSPAGLYSYQWDKTHRCASQAPKAINQDERSEGSITMIYVPTHYYLLLWSKTTTSWQTPTPACR